MAEALGKSPEEQEKDPKEKGRSVSPSIIPYYMVHLPGTLELIMSSSMITV